MPKAVKSEPELLTEFWATFVQDVNDPPAPSLSEAVVSLQAVCDGLTTQQGEDFFNAVATVYCDLGLTVQATYVAMRTEISQEGEETSNTVFGVISGKVASLSETSPVFGSLRLYHVQDVVTEIAADISTIETHRDAQSDPAVIEALNDGIVALQRQHNALIGELD